MSEPEREKTPDEGQEPEYTGVQGFVYRQHQASLRLLADGQERLRNVKAWRDAARRHKFPKLAAWLELYVASMTTSVEERQKELSPVRILISEAMKLDELLKKEKVE